MSKLNHFLSDIKVIDLTRHLPGPFATLLFVDMGADVIKIEPPSGDEARILGRKNAKGRTDFFDAINAGKKTRMMDFTNAEQVAIFIELVKTADILLESFRPGVMDKLGIGFKKLREINPGLICCSLPGYGSGTPMSHAAGHDANYLSMAGVLGATGAAEKPYYFNPPVADCTGSLTAVSSILGALHARNRTGEGCEIEVALADVVMPLQTMFIAELNGTGKSPEREKEMLNGGAAFYRIYETKDNKHVMLGSVEPKFWKAFCEAAGREDLIVRQWEPTPQTAIIKELDELFGGLTLAECEAKFIPADCCFTAIIDLQQALESPYHQARKLVRKDETGAYQSLFPVYVDGEPPELRTELIEE